MAEYKREEDNVEKNIREVRRGDNTTRSHDREQFTHWSNHMSSPHSISSSQALTQKHKRWDEGIWHY